MSVYGACKETSTFTEPARSTWRKEEDVQPRKTKLIHLKPDGKQEIKTQLTC